jgi:hypothetical protein
MGMTYDAARGEVVLFGGTDDDDLGDTWTWDGTDWTQRTPAHHPSARFGMGMTYDSARSEVVLFGGAVAGGDDTWTWDGTDWTQRTPPHAPPGRWDMGMTYDAARGQVVLFGGLGAGYLRDTWIWDGTDWIQRTPMYPPLGRSVTSMTYDAARGEVVMFGGIRGNYFYGDTWTWDGTRWTRRFAKHHPSKRSYTTMAYDLLRGQVVMFGGHRGFTVIKLGDTWTWDGTDWAVPFPASIKLIPSSGPPLTVVQVTGWSFGAWEQVVFIFIDSSTGATKFATTRTDWTGVITTQVTIPGGATPGEQMIKAKGFGSGQTAKRTFTVT